MSFPNLALWSHLLSTIGIEVCAVVSLGMIAQSAFRRAYWKRAMWQMTLLCLVLVSASEWTGAGRGAVSSLLGKKRIEQTSVPLTVSSSVKYYTTISAVISPLPAPQKPIWWPGFIWLGGAVIVLGRMTTAQGLLLVLRFRRRKIVGSVLQERVTRVAKVLGLRRKVCLLRLPESISPMAFGILFPTIGLPPGFETGFGAVEQDAILAHELAHLAMLDPLWFRLADFASALLWWHPLAWWARRSLHGTSELAADEATALVADGPGSLARCLVGLGKKMTLGHGWGWVGINGEFRSKLGKRVERLTRMPAKAGRPFVSWTDTVTRIAVAILIVPSTVLLLFAAFQTARGERENGWRESWDSSPAGLLAMAASEEADKRAEKVPIATRIMNAKLLYEMRKLEAAKAILKQVIKDDPSNGSAAYYMDLIKETQLAKNAEALITTVGQGTIISKLNSLTLDRVDYDLPLTSVLARLRAWSQKADPTGLGIKFLIDGYANDSSGSISVLPKPWTDMDSVNIKISPPLHKLRLKDVLEAIVMSADQPIEYKIEDYGVVFSPKPAKTITLYLKTFHLDPNTFIKSIEAVSGINSGNSALDNGKSTDGKQVDDTPRAADNGHDSFGGPASSSSQVGLNFVKRTNNTVQLDTIVRSYFTAAGVDLTDPGKSVFFNDRLGLLLVRATAEDLQRIETAIGILNQSPSKVVLKPTKSDTLHSKAFQLYTTEFKKNLLAAMGSVPASNVERTNDTAQFNQLLLAYFARAGAKLTPPDETLISDDRASVLIIRATPEKLQIIEQAIGPLNKVPPQITISSEFVELSQFDGKALGFGQFLQEKKTNLISVMSPSEYRVAINAIKQNTPEDVLSMTKVTTLSGRQAHIAAQDLQKIVIGTTTTNMLIGPVLDIISTVAADGYSIKTVLIPTYMEFPQYDSPGKFIPSSGNKTGASSVAASPLPPFRTRQEVSICEALDGQTLVTGRLVSDKPAEPKKLHLYFVTPRIIDPAGNFVHSDEELSAKH